MTVPVACRSSVDAWCWHGITAPTRAASDAFVERLRALGMATGDRLRVEMTYHGPQTWNGAGYDAGADVTVWGVLHSSAEWPEVAVSAAETGCTPHVGDEADE